MNRVLVVGCSGAGKSTLAAQISESTGLPYVPTDSFYWEADWKPTPVETIVTQLEDTISKRAWVLDGNFIDQRDRVWRQADTVIWLDLPRGRVLSRIVRRNVGWWFTRSITWSGNRMTWRRAWSGIRHSFRSHEKKRRAYPTYLREFPHLKILRFRSPAEVRLWLTCLQSSS